MARLLLHIGSPKTGSSAIQKALGRRQASLLSHGIALPDVNFVIRDSTLDSGNGEWLANFLTGIWPANSAKGQQTLKALKDLLDERKDTILSSENFYYALDGTLAHIGTAIRHAYSEIAIVIYVRNPVDMCFSLWLQGVKRAFASPVTLENYAAQFTYDPDAVIRRFRTAFPAASIHVRNYDSVRTHLVGDFWKVLEASFKVDLGVSAAEPSGESLTSDDGVIVNRSLFKSEVVFMQALTEYLASKHIPAESILEAKRVSSDLFLAYNEVAEAVVCPSHIADVIAERSGHTVQAINETYAIGLTAEGQSRSGDALPAAPDGFSRAISRIAGNALSRVPPSMPVVYLRKGDNFEFDGYVDQASSILVSGWVVCKTFPTSSVLVLVTAGALETTLVANIFREDVAAEFPGYSPYCGFYYEFDGGAAESNGKDALVKVCVLGCDDALPGPA